MLLSSDKSSVNIVPRYLYLVTHRINVGLYFQAPLTAPRSALACGISWRVPSGVSMRNRRSKNYMDNTGTRVVSEIPVSRFQFANGLSL